MINLFSLNKKKRNREKASQTSSLVACNVVGKPVWTPRQYDALAREGYSQNVIVYRAVNLVSRSAASVPWRLHLGNKEIIAHPLLDLLHKPNPLQGGASFIEACLAFKLLSGNSYIEAVCDKGGLPVELYCLRPDRMKIIPGKNGVPKAYQYSVNGQDKIIPVDPINGFSNILHLKMFHPLDDWYGMSPIEAAAHAIDQNNAVSSHNLAILQNGGRPTGALISKSDQPLTQEQIEILREGIQANLSGSHNAGRVLVLEGGLDWKEMGLSPKDLDFINGKAMSAREIVQAFGVPPMLVGVPGDSTFANYKEARLHLWEDTIIPLLDHLCDEFNSWLLPQFSEKLTLSFDLDGIPALANRRETLWKKITESNFLTTNEKRSALGYAPIKGGDTLPQGEKNHAK